MKKLLTIAMMTAAVSALATESSNTFGILRVDSSAAQTIVSVPWEAAGGGAIKVKDVVKTANLNNGDQLYYFDGSNYKLWVLGANGWEGATTVAHGITPSKGTDEDTLARGGAIILVRNNPAASFYLYGQYTTAGSSTTCVAGGFTLLAPPSTEDTNLNTKTWTTPGANDYIVLSDMTLLHYRADANDNNTKKWGKITGKSLNTSTGAITESIDFTKAVIKAGEGAWYKSASSAVTVTW